MKVSLDGGVVTFKLAEYVRRENHIPTVEELSEEDRRRKRPRITWETPYGRAYPEFDFIRTGELSIEISNQYLNGYRRSWKDGKRQRLEDVIEDISIGIITYAAGLKKQREESERRARNWERQSRVSARAQSRRNREDERSKILDELVAISTEAAKLRTWLSETETWPQPAQPNDSRDLLCGQRSDSAILNTRSNPIALPKR